MDVIQTFFIILFTIMAFSFVPAAWIMYIVREKDTRCKHQQVKQYDLWSYSRVLVSVRASVRLRVSVPMHCTCTFLV